VRTFYDSNVDVMGDFAGQAEKLDCSRQQGITANWLITFFPSPLCDDGFDISD